MSRLRDLFQKPDTSRYDYSRASVEFGPNGHHKAPELHQVPVVEADLTPASRLICHTDPGGPGADRFRFLGMRLRERGDSGKLKTLLVTSPMAHDGKSTVIMNLATVLAERGKSSVLVVEADFHRASLVQQLRLKDWPGLAESLYGRLDVFSAIRRVEPLNWYLLPAGSAIANPTELLQTPALSAVMQKLAPYFDWVLIDSPPVLPLTDALMLQRQSDATLLVVRAGSTPDHSVEETIELLGRQNIAGVILNAIDGLDKLYLKYGYYGKKPLPIKVPGDEPEED
jgi:capsular exopolysaccharide synthesis family protein